MPVLLPLLMLWMLLNPALTMDAASAACRLFVTSVLPGLFPYMVLALMLVSRLSASLPPMGLVALGWCGGSPTGARLLGLYPGDGRKQRIFLAVSTATMSPMFLLGTVGGWLGSRWAGTVVLGSVVIGGGLAGLLAGRLTNGDHRKPPAGPLVSQTEKAPPAPLSFGEAVEQAAKTMLLVCGTMVMLRVTAALTTAAWPDVALPLTTLLEVTTGAVEIAALPLPLPLRTAIIAGATGFGGTASVMQNRALYPPGLISLPEQLLWQAVHGGVSFLLALGVMLLTA
ncbi:MAG: hypothetical protein J1E43_05325 [Christensenellaceae bacterium]|nr:hypothetical protein [Christensenellaceae bacterium]